MKIAVPKCWPLQVLLLEGGLLSKNYAEWIMFWVDNMTELWEASGAELDEIAGDAEDILANMGAYDATAIASRTIGMSGFDLYIIYQISPKGREYAIRFRIDGDEIEHWNFSS